MKTKLAILIIFIVSLCSLSLLAEQNLPYKIDRLQSSPEVFLFWDEEKGILKIWTPAVGKEYFTLKKTSDFSKEKSLSLVWVSKNKESRLRVFQKERTFNLKNGERIFPKNDWPEKLTGWVTKGDRLELKIENWEGDSKKVLDRKDEFSSLKLFLSEKKRRNHLQLWEAIESQSEELFKIWDERLISSETDERLLKLWRDLLAGLIVHYYRPAMVSVEKLEKIYRSLLRVPRQREIFSVYRDLCAYFLGDQATLKKEQDELSKLLLSYLKNQMPEGINEEEWIRLWFAKEVSLRKTLSYALLPETVKKSFREGYLYSYLLHRKLGVTGEREEWVEDVWSLIFGEKKKLKSQEPGILFLIADENENGMSLEDYRIVEKFFQTLWGKHQYFVRMSDREYGLFDSQKLVWVQDGRRWEMHYGETIRPYEIYYEDTHLVYVGNEFSRILVFVSAERVIFYDFSKERELVSREVWPVIWPVIRSDTAISSNDFMILYFSKEKSKIQRRRNVVLVEEGELSFLFNPFGERLEGNQLATDAEFLFYSRKWNPHLLGLNVSFLSREKERIFGCKNKQIAVEWTDESIRFFDDQEMWGCELAEGVGGKVYYNEVPVR